MTDLDEETHRRRIVLAIGVFKDWNRLETASLQQVHSIIWGQCPEPESLTDDTALRAKMQSITDPARIAEIAPVVFGEGPFSERDFEMLELGANCARRDIAAALRARTPEETA